MFSEACPGDASPESRAILMVDGQPVGVKRQPMTVLLHQQDMVIEAPGYVVIDPETTIGTCRDVCQDEWVGIRSHPHFLSAWLKLWEPQEPPMVLSTAGLGSRHSVGMILLLMKCRGEKKSPHLKYPETYLHPAQCARIVTMLHYLGFGK